MAFQSPDVIVVGAGIIGAAIAWRLSQAGSSVALVDAGAVGGEASWAGAGMLAPGGELAGHTTWARFALDSLSIYPAFVRELEDETGVPIDYRECGALEIAYTEPEWATILERRTSQEGLGIHAAAADVPPGAIGALFYPDDAIVDPRDVTRALRTACQGRGVRILEHTSVLEIRLAARHAGVLAARDTYSAAVVVLAAGAWSGSIPVTSGGRSLELPATFPVRGHLLGYTLAPGSLKPILRHGHTYLLQRSNGFTVVGTSSEQAGFDRNLDPAVIRDIRERASRLLPSLCSAPEPQAWLGFRPATADFEPRVGRVHDTPLWLAYGHYRNGILLAPATARRVAAEILA